MNNKYILAFLVLFSLILLAIVLDPQFTGFAIFDNMIKHGQTIKVDDTTFKVEFGENKLRLYSDQGEVIFQGTDKEVLRDEVFLLSDINYEQKTAKLMIQKYDLDVVMKRAVDVEELVLGDEVAVRTTITNNEVQPLSFEFHQYTSPAYELKQAIKVNGNQANFQPGKETYKYVITLQPNERIVLEYTLTLVNPDIKNTAVPRASLLQDVGENAFEIQAKEIPMKVTPLLSYELSNTENLAISKDHEITLTLKNNDPSKTLIINSLKLVLPQGISVQSQGALQKAGSELQWQGSLKNTQTLPFTLKSNEVETYDLLLTIMYDVNDLKLSIQHQQKLSFDVIPLKPIITLNKESFAGGENIEITPSFENEAGTAFKDLDAKITVLTENQTVTADALEGKEKLVFDNMISMPAPFSDTERKIPVVFAGTYKTMSDKLFNFSEEKVITLKQSAFEPDLHFSLLPIGYKKGTLQLLALAEKKSESQISLMKIIHDALKPDLVTEFSQVPRKAGVVFEVPTTKEDVKIEKINQEGLLVYTKDNEQYLVSATFLGEVKKIVKEIKLAKDKYKLSDIKLIDFSSGTAPILLNSEKQLLIYETPAVSFTLVYFILIVVAVAFTVIGIIWYQKRQEAKHRISVDTSFVPTKTSLGVFDAPTPDKGLLEGQKFVEYCRSAHLPDEKIKIKLREKGWLEDFINELCK